MENYYKILEVDKDASQEIIEKAYKLLVKRYHPDLQSDEEKSLAEEKIKKINEAYSILSDSNQRQNYNNQLQESTISVEQYQQVVDENNRLKKQLVYIAEELKSINHPTSNPQTDFRVNNPTHANYTNTNSNVVGNNENYSQSQQIKKEHPFIKRILKIFLIALFVGLVLFILLRAPFFQNIINTIFDSNILIVVIIVVILFFSSKR